MIDDRPAHLLSNQPPTVAQEAAAAIEDRLQALAERRDNIVNALPRVVVNDQETTGKAGDFIAITKRIIDEVDRIRVDVKRPYDEASSAVQARAQNFAQPLFDTVAEVEARVRDYRADQRERARKRAQEQRETEARLRAEAAAREAGKLAVDPAPAVVPVQAAEISLPTARGDYGSRVSDKVGKVWSITDPRALPDEILTAPKVRDAMLAAIKQLAKLRPEIPGAKYDVEVGEAIRKGA